MTLEEIKDFRSRFVRIHHEANGDKILVADWMQDHYDWLIAEVEKLQAENEDLHKEGMTIYAMMEDGRAKAAVTRCAEICEQEFGFSWLGCGKHLGAEIRKEFKL